MTNPSAIPALDFVDAPASRRSRCGAGDRACVISAAILPAQKQNYKLFHPLKCKFPSALSQRGG